jgi:hypothetical protein
VAHVGDQVRTINATNTILRMQAAGEPGCCCDASSLDIDTSWHIEQTGALEPRSLIPPTLSQNLLIKQISTLFTFVFVGPQVQVIEML